MKSLNQKYLPAAIAIALVLAAGVAMQLGWIDPSPLALAPALGMAALGMLNAEAGERLAVVGTIDPQTVSNTELFTDVVDMSKFHQCLGVALLGNMASETIDFKAYYCDSDGANATALISATQRAAHASNNDNKQIVINVRQSDLITAEKRYVKFGLVTGGATGGPAAVLAIGVDARAGQAADLDLSDVVEIKT